MGSLVRTGRLGVVATAALVGAHLGLAHAQDGPTFDATAVFQPGLSGAIETLTEVDDASAGETMALGGALFLRGVERTLQTRWRMGAVRGFEVMPILRLDLPQNPEPEPFSGAVIEQIFADLIADMAASRAALERIPDDVAFGLDLDLAALWFDINMNGERDSGEAVMDVAGGALLRRFSGVPDDILDAGLEVRFDAADAAWLTAYTHVLGGVGHLVLAFQPEQVIDQVLIDSAEMAALLPGGTLPDFNVEERDAVNAIAILIETLGQQPDPAHTRAARAEFLAMISENRRFWSRVAGETDNDREWIPNAQQMSALPVEFPEGLGDLWMNVLEEAEAVLNGDLLVEHWQYRAGNVGINVHDWFENPSPVDLVDWIHGRGLLPYAQKGALVSNQSWRRFTRLVSGNAGLFVILLN